MLNFISKTLFQKKSPLTKYLGPLQFFTAGGLSTYAIIRGIRLMAKRSKKVDQLLHKGFEAVEDKIGDLKEQVIPEENHRTT